MEAQQRPEPTRPGEPPATSRIGIQGVRAVLGHPAKVAAGFWAAGALAALTACFTAHWGPDGVGALLAIAGLGLLGSGVHFFANKRMPRWALHVGAAAALALVTTAAAVGASRQVDFAVFYIWVVVYAALFFSPVATVVYAAAVGVIYAVLLGIGPAVDNPLAAWLVIFATETVAGAVVLGLVSVLRSDARKDPLTGLANRRSWGERLEEEIERTRRAGTALSVAMIDIDNFKAVNDHQGHDAGDLLLQELSGAWQGVVRGGGDFLARLGGDEFGLLVPGSDASGVRRIASRLVEVAPEGVAYSIGVATWDGEETARNLLRRADQTMYREKLGRRGSR